MASLDRHASSVSPPALPEFTNRTFSLAEQPAGVCKHRRHALRRAAGAALPGERVAACGQKAIGQFVSLHHDAGRAHYGAVETCGSVWACPVCAAKITEGRREELDAVLRAHRDAGGTAFMATLTIPHHRFQTCLSLRKAVSAAWRRVKNGKAWLRARDGHGWMGDVRALEVTHGANGWHPHLHVLIFFEPGTPKDRMYSFGGWLFDAWAAAIERLGYGTCRKSAYTYEPVNADQGAADYVAKWSAALELTKAHTKQGRAGGRTPWQILGDLSGNRNSGDFALFREYALAFKGARQLTWSRNLRAHYLSEPEPADEELATEPQTPKTHAATIGRDVFKAIAARGMTAAVLTAHESGGLPAVLQTLSAAGIPWQLGEMPSFERGRSVPAILYRSGPGERPTPPPDTTSTRATKGTVR